LECDRVQLQQVLLNLVRNGTEAMGAVTGRPRVLRISATPNPASEALIAVEDSGVGLGAETADRIFEPLFTTKLDGMGTALSIAVDRRGRSWAPLWASPNVPNGTTFRFTVPLAAAQTRAQPTSPGQAFDANRAASVRAQFRGRGTVSVGGQ
jgi:signal transduction histidine kinase